VTNQRVSYFFITEFSEGTNKQNTDYEQKIGQSASNKEPTVINLSFYLVTRR